MNSEEYKLALAYTISLVRCGGDDVALLWEHDDLVAIQRAPKVDASGTGLALPIVRLLRNRGERLEKGFSISTTAQPTEACLGMARMCGIHYILYALGTSVHKITCGRAAATAKSFGFRFRHGSIPDVIGLINSKPVVVAWYKNPGNYKEHLKNWATNLGKINSHEGRAAEHAKTLTISSGDPTPSIFPSSRLEYLNLKSVVQDQTVLDNVIMMMAFEMVSRVSGFTTSAKGAVSRVRGARSGAYQGQNIGSLMSDNEGNIVGWGFNTNTQNSTRHGEVNLIVNFLTDNPDEKSLPNGGTIYSTLEPCEMCSGMIARTVNRGSRPQFRVIYGQKDANVSDTALQRKANPGIRMEPSNAALVTAQMIESGSATGASNKLVAAMATEQKSKGIIATTEYLKQKSTYEAFFGAARPNWWLYLWDYLTSRLAISGADHSKKASELLKDPAVMEVNNQLDIIYRLVDQFMNTVAAHARG